MLVFGPFGRWFQSLVSRVTDGDIYYIQNIVVEDAIWTFLPRGSLGRGSTIRRSSGVARSVCGSKSRIESASLLMHLPNRSANGILWYPKQTGGTSDTLDEYNSPLRHIKELKITI